MSGTLGILNVGAGDTKLSFDKSNPIERIRAARIVRDMLRRGYALLIETGKGEDGRPVYQRALDFDENTCEYIIADFDPQPAPHDTVPVEMHQDDTDGQTPQKTVTPAAPPQKRRGRPPKRIAAESTRGIAVARTAGG